MKMRIKMTMKIGGEGGRDGEGRRWGRGRKRNRVRMRDPWKFHGTKKYSPSTLGFPALPPYLTPIYSLNSLPISTLVPLSAPSHFLPLPPSLPYPRPPLSHFTAFSETLFLPLSPSFYTLRSPVSPPQSLFSL